MSDKFLVEHIKDIYYYDLKLYKLHIFNVFN